MSFGQRQNPPSENRLGSSGHPQGVVVNQSQQAGEEHHLNAHWPKYGAVGMTAFAMSKSGAVSAGFWLVPIAAMTFGVCYLNLVMMKRKWDSEVDEREFNNKNWALVFAAGMLGVAWFFYSKGITLEQLAALNWKEQLAFTPSSDFNAPEPLLMQAFGAFAAAGGMVYGAAKLIEKFR